MHSKPSHLYTVDVLKYFDVLNRYTSLCSSSAYTVFLSLIDILSKSGNNIMKVCI